MTQQRHSPDGFKPPNRDADILPFTARGETANPTEQNPARFYIDKWITLGFEGDELAGMILDDSNTTSEADDEQQASFKTALSKTALYDHYEAIIDADPVTEALTQLVQASKGEGMSPIRKAYLVLMDVRAIEIIDPDLDVAEQLAELPDEMDAHWRELLDLLV